MLLIGQWMEETAHYDQNTILKQYKVSSLLSFNLHYYVAIEFLL